MIFEPSHLSRRNIEPGGTCRGRLRDLLGVVLPIVLVAATLTALDPSPAAADDLTPAQKQELPTHFGFSSLEIFKIEFGISQLRTADFNNDGLTDLVVSNNKKSTIEVLLQRKEPPAESEEPAQVNDLINDWRFERKHVSVIWQVTSLKAAELTGDEHMDLVFFGDPKELVVLPGRGDGTFLDPVTQRVREGASRPEAVEVADLNGDGLTDVALLGDSDVLVFFQAGGEGLGQPVRFAHAVDNAVAIKAADLNGDGRADLILLTQDAEYPLQVRYQDAIGNLGPIQRVKLPAIRSTLFAACGAQRADLFGVERVSGRLKRWSFQRSIDANATDDWAVLYYPVPGKSEGERLPLAIGDVTGDGLPDLVSADVDAAQLVLFRQRSKSGLLPPELFGGQVKMRDMCGFDTDGNGVDEVYILSPDEESITRSVYRDNRLTFPKPLPTIGKPYVLHVGRLSGNGDAVMTYVSRNKSSEYQLVIQSLRAGGGVEPAKTYPVEDLDEPPSGIRLADVNRDGLNDVLIFVPYEPLITFIQGSDGQFVLLGAEGGAQTGLVKQATVEGFAYADTDGDGANEVLLAQKMFVRALYVNKEGAWEVLDQYNAPGSDSELTGVCALAMPNSSRPHLAVYDKRSREVHLFAPADGGTYRKDRSVRVGSFELKAMLSAPIGGGGQPSPTAKAMGHPSAKAMGRPSIVLADKRRVAVILPGVPAARARERGTYESSIKDARLTAMAAGDVNHDGVADVAVIDVKDHFVEILTLAPDGSLIRANKFRVFAKKQYRSMDRGTGEPRWITMADVTNDKVDDLLLIAHDRILLYPGQ